VKKLENRRLGLEGEKMKMFQNIECCCGVGRNRSGWVPARTKELSGRVLSCLAVAIIEPDFVDATGINKHEIVASGRFGVAA
jgi:hypothetical protein